MEKTFNTEYQVLEVSRAADPPKLTTEAEKNLVKMLEDELLKNQELVSLLSTERHRASELEDWLSQLKGGNCRYQGSYQESDAASCFSQQSECTRYSDDIRRLKIARYLAKREKRRQKVIMVRSFPGRQIVATQKPRLNGKFVKTDVSLSTQ